MMGPCRVWRQRQALGGLAVSRAFGDLGMALAGVIAEPEITQEPITEAHRFLILASDGVWEHMSNQDAVDAAAKHTDPRRAADAVVQEARRQWQVQGQGYIDDITALVVKL